MELHRRVWVGPIEDSKLPQILIDLRNKDGSDANEHLARRLTENLGMGSDFDFKWVSDGFRVWGLRCWVQALGFRAWADCLRKLPCSLRSQQEGCGGSFTAFSMSLKACSSCTHMRIQAKPTARIYYATSAMCQGSKKIFAQRSSLHVLAVGSKP